jgi:DNA mismatch endonuclease (patch repair protein)
MDSITQEHRSWNMSRIKGRDTEPEMIVRSVLHRLGLRFRLHKRDLPGRPDITLKKYRTVVFVHGCFWHRHRKCSMAYSPKSNQKFWSDKFKANVDRDRTVVGTLRRMGWRVIVVWECQTSERDVLSRRLKSILR